MSFVPTSRRSLSADDRVAPAHGFGEQALHPRLSREGFKVKNVSLYLGGRTREPAGRGRPAEYGGSVKWAFVLSMHLTPEHVGCAIVGEALVEIHKPKLLFLF